MINPFIKPKPQDVRKNMLHEAELHLLDQQQKRDYHTAMCTMLEERVKKLRTAVTADQKDPL